MGQYEERTGLHVVIQSSFLEGLKSVADFPFFLAMIAITVVYVVTSQMNTRRLSSESRGCKAESLLLLLCPPVLHSNRDLTSSQVAMS